MEKTLGFLAPALIYLFVFILNALMPGRWVTGYVTRTNSTEKLRYRLNGLFVLFIVIFTWALLCYSGFIAWDWLYVNRWNTLTGGIIIGLIFLFTFFIKEKSKCPSGMRT
jgi:hypothetical protein